MGRIWRAIRFFWIGANALSTAQWLLGLLPAGVVGVIVGWVANAERLPPVTIGVLALAAFALAYVIYVAWRIEHAPRIPQQMLDQANAAAGRHWIRPAAPADQAKVRSPTVQDVLDAAEDEDRKTAVRLSAVLPVSNSGTRDTGQRNCYLDEALGWAIHGAWGK